MGTICILVGVIALIACTGAGFLASNYIQARSILANNFSSATSCYLTVVGVFAFIGLMICLTLVICGLTYNRSCKNAELLKKALRR